MPLYEYQCGRCGRFELIQKFSDAPLAHCPTCGGEVHKLLSAPAIQFKGSGWYVTDYGRKGNGGKAGAGGSKSGSESSAKEGSSASSSSGSGSKESSASSTPASKTPASS